MSVQMILVAGLYRLGTGDNPAPITAHLDAACDEMIFHLASRRLVEKSDACLRIGGPSAGADEVVGLARRHGKAVYFSLDEVPAAGCPA